MNLKSLEAPEFSSGEPPSLVSTRFKPSEALNLFSPDSAVDDADSAASASDSTISGTKPVDRVVEEEYLRKLKAQGSTIVPEQKPEPGVAALPAAPAGRLCQCGFVDDPEAAFCSECGSGFQS